MKYWFGEILKIDGGMDGTRTITKTLQIPKGFFQSKVRASFTRCTGLVYTISPSWIISDQLKGLEILYQHISLYVYHNGEQKPHL